MGSDRPSPPKPEEGLKAIKPKTMPAPGPLRRPTRYVTQASPGCLRQRIAGGRDITLPPEPQIKADRRGAATIAISYSFKRLPPRCLPVRLDISVQRSDILGGQHDLVKIRGRRGRILLRIRPIYRKADVVRVTAVSKAGIPGDEVAVLIR